MKLTENLSNKEIIRYRPDIDGLRAIAVLLVIGYHFFPELMPGGFIGVDIFFVISGYLISQIIYRQLISNSFSLFSFYSRRIIRIFPALILVLLTSYVLGWLVLFANEYWLLGKHIAGGAGFVANLVFWGDSGYFEKAAQLKPLLHLWSLGIEEQFYIFFPLALLLFYKLRANIFFAISTLILGSFFLNIYSINIDPVFTFYNPLTRMWEILIGASSIFLSPIFLKIRTSYKLNNFFSILGFALIVAGVLFTSNTSPFPGYWALLPTMGAALIISTGSEAILNRKVLAIPPLVFIGLISYPLYLWHWPLFSFSYILSGGPLDTSLKIGLLMFSILLAYLTYRFIETPIRLSKHYITKVLALMVLMVCTGLAGYNIYARDGLSFRIPQKISPQESHFKCKDYEICSFGNPDAKKIIVIYGDSYVAHLTNALNEVLGQDYKFYLLWGGGCFTGSNLLYPQSGDKVKCPKFKEFIKPLSGLHIDAVITAQSWFGYGIAMPNGMEEALKDRFIAHNLNPKKIIILGPTGQIDYDCILSNINKRPYSFGKSCKKNEGSITVANQFEEITRITKAPKNISYVFPAKILCPNGECKALTDGKLNYQDYHHLSLDGALPIAQEIKKILAD